MHDADVQVIRIGPGSQPTEEDGSELEYLPMPHEMATYRPALLPEREEIAGMEAGLRVLRDIGEQLAVCRAGAAARPIALAPLDDANRRFLHQVLGEGEVSARSTPDEQLRVQETRLTGVWWVGLQAHDQALAGETLEVADVPAALRSLAFANLAPPPEIAPPPGIMNALPVLAELRERSRAWRPGDAAHVVNLSLLPLTETDLAYIDASLGAGGILMLSRGYGNCRISATALPQVWWVQHFNNDEKLILNTLVVRDVPTEAMAAAEDFADSAERLAGILEALQ
jgi:hydrogenase-1 operon protein HyaF